MISRSNSKLLISNFKSIVDFSSDAQSINNFINLTEEKLYESWHDKPKFVEGYERNITFLGAKSTLYWNIKQLRKFSNKFSTQSFPTHKLLNVVDMFNINFNHLNSSSKKPILLVELPFVHEGYCIADGNHKIVAAHRNSHPLVNAIYFNYKSHYKFMSKPSSELFKIFCDINFYVLKKNNAISLEQLNNSSFYLKL